MVRAVCKCHRFDVVGDTINRGCVVTGSVLPDSTEFRWGQWDSTAGARCEWHDCNGRGIRQSCAYYKLNSAHRHMPEQFEYRRYGWLRKHSELLSRLSTCTRGQQHKCSVARGEWLSGSAQQCDRLRYRASQSEKYKYVDADLRGLTEIRGIIDSHALS